MSVFETDEDMTDLFRSLWYWVITADSSAKRKMEAEEDQVMKIQLVSPWMMMEFFFV